MLRLITKESDALFVFAQPRKGKAELRANQKSARQIDNDKDAEREIVVDRPLVDFITAERHRRDRGNAVLSAQIVPAPGQPIRCIGSGQRAERDEDNAGRMPAKQQEAAQQQAKSRDRSAGPRAVPRKIDVTPRSRASSATP